MEGATVEFMRTAPVDLIAGTIRSLVAGIFDAVNGVFGLPLADDELPLAPWACPGCWSKRGFRRRGLRPGGRRV